jgi:hypothetical protein
MFKTSRRHFLTSGGSALVYPLFPSFSRSPSADIHFPQFVEPEWREPGQTKDPEYLRTAKLRYSADGYEVVGKNRTCFNNRPLYCDPTANGVVLGGDRPFVRLLSTPNVLGGFAAAIVRKGRGKWFHYYDQVESWYRCGRMAWQISDPSLEGLQVMLEVVPIAGVSGFALRMNAEGLCAGDRLICSFGEARREGDVRTIWDPVMHGNPKVLKLGNPRKPEMSLAIDPERCAGNQATLEGAIFRILPAADSAQSALGTSLPASVLRVVDASAARDPARYSKSTAGNMPMVCGVLELPPGEQTVHWAVQSAAASANPISLRMASPATAFAEGGAYLKSVERVQVETPDPYLNATLVDVCHAIDGSCDRNPYIFRHGCMAFSIHFLGWRVICGATALGWHDRVKGAAAYYTALQVRDGQGRDAGNAIPGRRDWLDGPQPDEPPLNSALGLARPAVRMWGQQQFGSPNDCRPNLHVQLAHWPIADTTTPLSGHSTKPCPCNRPRALRHLN